MADPQQIVQSQTTIPDYAKPYVERMLGQAEAISQSPLGVYPQERIAGFDPLQMQAYRQAANMRLPYESQFAPSTMMQYAQQAAQTGYNPQQYGSSFNAPTAYSPTDFSYQTVSPERASTTSFASPNAASAYMSPYMQSVVDVQQREAQRSADIAGTQRAARATQSGAFGGSRQAIENAEAARNLATQKGDIQAAGLQSAYQQAQGQFNVEQQARLQAQLANQQTGLQGQLANQQMGYNTQQAGEAARQFGYGQQMQAAGLGAQYGLAANQLNAQQQQFGAGLGLQGLQAGMQGLGQYGTLTNNLQQQQQNLANLQNAYGTQAQQQQQNILSQQYQDFLNQQNQPYRQVGFMSDVLRGVPLSQQTQSTYQAPPSFMSQVAGLGVAGLGLANLGKTASNVFGKEGGHVRTKQMPSKLAGLPALAVSKIGKD